MPRGFRALDGPRPEFAELYGVREHTSDRYPPRTALNVKESRALYNLVKEQGRDGAAGIVQGEKGLAYIEFAREAEEKAEEKSE